MDAKKARAIVIRVVVTFVEAGAAYWIASGQKTDKIALSGAVGAGLSAVYNLTKHFATN